MDTKEQKFAPLLNRKMFTNLSTNPLFMNTTGYGFSIIPNPDSLISDKGLRSKIWGDLLSDSHLSGAMDARKASVEGMLWELNSEGTENEFAAEIIKGVFNGGNVATLINGILDCLLWGFQPIEVVWGLKAYNEKTFVVPVDFIPVSPHLFGFNARRELCFRGSSNLIEDVVDKRKFVCPTYKATALNPYGYSLLSRCYWPVNWKRGVRKFWVDYLERFGFPHVKIAYNRGGVETSEIESVANMVASSLQDSVFAIPDDFGVEVINNANSGGAELFQAFINSCDDEISKAVLGHTGSMRSEAGRLGGENVAADSKLDKKLADKKLVEDTINAIIGLIYEQNFPMETARVKFSLYDEKNIGMERANLDAVLYGMNVRFSDKYMMDTYGLPEGEFWQLDKKPTALEQLAASPTVKGTVGGIQVVAALVEKYETNLLSRESCIALAQISFGYTEEEAQKLFPVKLGKFAQNFAAESDVEAVLPQEKIVQEIGDSMAAQVMEEIAKSSSLEDALQRVNSLYPKLDSSQLLETIERMYFASLVIGAIEETNG